MRLTFGTACVFVALLATQAWANICVDPLAWLPDRVTEIGECGQLDKAACEKVVPYCEFNWDADAGVCSVKARSHGADAMTCCANAGGLWSGFIAISTCADSFNAIGFDQKKKCSDIAQLPGMQVQFTYATLLNTLGLAGCCGPKIETYCQTSIDNICADHTKSVADAAVTTSCHNITSADCSSSTNCTFIYDIKDDECTVDTARCCTDRGGKPVVKETCADFLRVSAPLFPSMSNLTLAPSICSEEFPGFFFNYSTYFRRASVCCSDRQINCTNMVTSPMLEPPANQVTPPPESPICRTAANLRKNFAISATCNITESQCAAAESTSMCVGEWRNNSQGVGACVLQSSVLTTNDQGAAGCCVSAGGTPSDPVKCDYYQTLVNQEGFNSSDPKTCGWDFFGQPLFLPTLRPCCSDSTMLCDPTDAYRLEITNGCDSPTTKRVLQLSSGCNPFLSEDGEMSYIKVSTAGDKCTLDSYSDANCTNSSKYGLLEKAVGTKTLTSGDCTANITRKVAYTIYCGASTAPSATAPSAAPSAAPAKITVQNVKFVQIFNNVTEADKVSIKADIVASYSNAGVEADDVTVAFVTRRHRAVGDVKVEITVKVVGNAAAGEALKKAVKDTPPTWANLKQTNPAAADAVKAAWAPTVTVTETQQPAPTPSSAGSLLVSAAIFLALAL